MKHKPKSYKKFVAVATTATLVASVIKPTEFDKKYLGEWDKFDDQPKEVLTRDQKIEMLISYIWDIEEATLGPVYFESYTDEELDKEIVWKEHLMNK